MGIPDCFGIEWDQNDAACAGGRDPAYVGPDGSHIRERCDFFNTCASRKQANTLEERRLEEKKREEQRLIPTGSLFRNYQATPPAAAPAPNSTQEYMIQQMKLQLDQQKRIIEQQQLSLQQRPAYAQQMAQQAIGLGQMIPAVANQLEMMSMNMAVPKYLSVPEPRRKDKSIWTLLARELLRSIFKSAGHTVANFWDHTPFDREE